MKRRSSSTASRGQSRPWVRITRQLEEVGGRSAARLRKELERALPQLVAQVDRDARSAELAGLWAQSRNHDEFADCPIVDGAILAALEQRFGVSGDGRVAHAGLIHTYGYLLSNLETAFGSKRQRWTDPGVDRALGFTTPTVRPFPREGTLLSNLTVLLGRVAFRPGSAAWRRAGRMSQAVASTVSGALTVHRWWRIDERPAGASNSLPTLRTDLLEFTDRADLAALLVYSIASARGLRERLITAFPMGRAGVDQLLDSPQGPRIRGLTPRYNAFVRAWPVAGVVGRRKISERELAGLTTPQNWMKTR